MKPKTFEEISQETIYTYGTEVTVIIPNHITFEGKIVGLATFGVEPRYIVECIDNFLPNSTYPYKVTSIGASNIHLRKKETYTLDQIKVFADALGISCTTVDEWFNINVKS